MKTLSLHLCDKSSIRRLGKSVLISTDKSLNLLSLDSIESILFANVNGIDEIQISTESALIMIKGENLRFHYWNLLEIYCTKEHIISNSYEVFNPYTGNLSFKGEPIFKYAETIISNINEFRNKHFNEAKEKDESNEQ